MCEAGTVVHTAFVFYFVVCFLVLCSLFCLFFGILCGWLKKF